MKLINTHTQSQDMYDHQFICISNLLNMVDTYGNLLSHRQTTFNQLNTKPMHLTHDLRVQQTSTARHHSHHNARLSGQHLHSNLHINTTNQPHSALLHRYMYITVTCWKSSPHDQWYAYQSVHKWDNSRWDKRKCVQCIWQKKLLEVLVIADWFTDHDMWWPSLALMLTWAIRKVSL